MVIQIIERAVKAEEGPQAQTSTEGQMQVVNTNH